MKKKAIRIIISYVLLLILVGIFVVFFSQRKDQLVRLREVPIMSVVLIGALAILHKGINAFSSKKLMQAFNINLSFKEWFGLACMINMTNYFLPVRSGMGARAFYMKNKHDFPYPKFLASYMGLYVFSYLATAVVGMLLLGFIYLVRGIFYWKILIFFVAAFAATGGFMLSWKFFSKRKFRFEIVNHVFKGLNYFRKQRGLLIVLLGLSFLSITVLAVRFLVVFMAIGAQPGLANMLIIASLVYFSFVMALTPSNLGVKESIITIVAGILGLSTIDGALVAIIDRGINFLLTFVLGIFFSVVLFRELKFGKHHE